MQTGVFQKGLNRIVTHDMFQIHMNDIYDDKSYTGKRQYIKSQ